MYPCPPFVVVVWIGANKFSIALPTACRAVTGAADRTATEPTALASMALVAVGRTDAAAKGLAG